MTIEAQENRRRLLSFFAFEQFPDLKPMGWHHFLVADSWSFPTFAPFPAISSGRNPLALGRALGSPLAEGRKDANCGTARHWRPN
jgi:hypothetical protein